MERLKRFLRRVLLCVIILTGFTYFAKAAGEVVVISGIVTDEKAAPMMGVSVVLTEATPRRGSATDETGFFALSVSAGISHLRFSYIGYAYVFIDVICNKDTLINITMRSSSVMVDEVIISDTRVGSGTPLTTSELGREELREKNVGAALPYLLELQPSMVSTAENGTQIGNTSFRLRGTDATRINVNINGVPLNDPESQAVYWVNIPNLAGMAQSIQIQRGIGASTGGSSAFGGAVNIETLSVAEHPYATMDLSYGSFNTLQTSANIGSGMLKHGFSVDAGYTKLVSDGYIRNGYCDHQSFFLSAGKYGKRSLLKVVAILGQQTTGITWNGTHSDMLEIDRTYNDAGEYYDDAGNVRYYDNETDNYWQDHVQVYYSYMLTDRWTLNAAADYAYGFGYYENYKYNKSFGKYGLENPIINGGECNKSDFIVRKYLDNDLIVGNIAARYHSERLSLSFGEMMTFFYNEHYGDVLWSKYNDGSISENYRWYYNDSHKNDATSFFKADLKLSSSWQLYADIQYRYAQYVMKGEDDDLGTLDQTHYYSFFNPKAGFTYIPSDKHRVYFLTGIVNREPTRADLKDALKYGGQEVPKPETMLDVETGYSYNPSSWMISANLYFMGYKDQLVSSGKLNDVGYVLMENVAKSYRIGLETVAGVQILSWLNLEANLTLSRNKVVDYVYYKDMYDDRDNWNSLGQEAEELGNTDIAFSPSVVSAAVLKIEPVKNFFIQFTGKYVGRQYYDNTSREETCLDDYFVMNGKLSYALNIGKNDEVEFQFLVNNILNNLYSNNAWGYTSYFQDGGAIVDSYYFPQPGINCMGRVVLKIR
ncbi:MAG: carboxypeptidase-like regulatory domain-containing protein [Bacteroidales bacterium]|nr:carboxypeptidase-like regulatory domain-containing protein [Bacteroidales bacterium]